MVVVDAGTEERGNTWGTFTKPLTHTSVSLSPFHSLSLSPSQHSWIEQNDHWLEEDQNLLAPHTARESGERERERACAQLSGHPARKISCVLTTRTERSKKTSLNRHSTLCAFRNARVMGTFHHYTLHFPFFRIFGDSKRVAERFQDCFERGQNEANLWTQWLDQRCYEEKKDTWPLTELGR